MFFITHLVYQCSTTLILISIPFNIDETKSKLIDRAQ